MREQEGAFFSSPSLTGLIQQIQHLCLFGADVLVVQGDVGSGKTALYTHLCKEIRSSATVTTPIHVSSLSLHQSIAPEALLSLVCEAIGLPASPESSNGELLIQLRSYSQQLIKEHKLSVLFIDNAHRISNDVLAALLSLLQGDGQDSVGLRFVFFALPGLIERLDELELLDVTIYDFQVPAYSAVELERFLSHKFPEFDQWLAAEKVPSVQSLWHRSKGNPGLAISFVGQALDDTSEPTISSDIKKIPIPHIVALAVLISSLMIVFLFRDDDKQELASQPLPPMLPDTYNAEPESEQVAKNLTATPSIVAKNASAPSPLPHTSVSQPPATNVEKKAFPDENAHNPGAPKAAIVTNEVSSSNIPAPKAVVKSASEAVSNVALSSDETRLLAINDASYMLQLVAASNGDTLKAYVTEQVNSDQLYIYRKRRPNGTHWYVVVLGPYSSSRAAQSAIAKLPENQKRAGPWPKRITAIKQDIAVFRGRE